MMMTPDYFCVSSNLGRWWCQSIHSWYHWRLLAVHWFLTFSYLIVKLYNSWNGA